MSNLADMLVANRDMGGILVATGGRRIEERLLEWRDGRNNAGVVEPVIVIKDGLRGCCVSEVETALAMLARDSKWRRLVIPSDPGAPRNRRRGMRCDVEACRYLADVPVARVPCADGEGGDVWLIYERNFLTEEQMKEQGIMKGVIAATRSAANPGHLQAWLDYYLRFCERAAVVVHAQVGESLLEVEAVLAKWGDRVVWSVWREDFFSNDATLAQLRDLVATKTEGVAVIHVDRDEFLDGADKIRESVGRLLAGECDYAQGWMACRLAPGCRLYPDDLPTREAFLRAAPVRSCAIKEYKANHFKVWLTRWPHIKLHDAKDMPKWKRDESMLAIDHFRWHHRLREFAKEKAFAYLVKYKDSRFGHWAWMEMEAWNRTSAFIETVKKHFHPLSDRLAGWFDYPDVYRQIVDEAPAGASVVEIGVWRGRSLGYLAEYAALVGKDLTMIGYDQFDPAYRLGPPEEGMSSDQWLARVQADMAAVAPWNTPKVVRSDSVAAAANHADGSLFAVWIDGGHNEEDVFRDVEAWRPKVMSGGILAGHDLQSHPGVVAGLKKAGVAYQAVSRNAWLARMP